MTPGVLLAMLRTAPDPTQEIIRLVQSPQFNPRKSIPTRDDVRGADWYAARGDDRDDDRATTRNVARDAAWDAARDAAWDAARGAAWDAARGAAWDAARNAARNADAAWDASLLAGVMVVQDLIGRRHLDFALENFCYWMEE